MIPLHVTLSFYKRKDVQEAIIELVEDREVAVRYSDYFGKRPDVLSNPLDVLELAKGKATSFHCSEERWSNPLQLNPTLKRHQLNENRKGWDLVIDIDCGIFEYSRIAADLVIKAFKFYDINSVSCKFSGNKGFHIAVPFEAFPKTIQEKETSDLFPDAAKDIALYLTSMIKKPLGREIIKYEGDFSKVVSKTNCKPEEITYKEKDEQGNLVTLLDPEPFLNIDTILISSRHLFRSVYSLHEKSGLASVPVEVDKVLEFERYHAKPESVEVSSVKFLDRNGVSEGEAAKLLSQSLDFGAKEKVKQISSEISKDSKYSMDQEMDAVPEELFPPCMKLIKQGITDGKKRSLFAVVNYLNSVGWSYEQIETWLKEWNKSNQEPIRETLLVGQVRYHKQQKKRVLPPNCDNQMYYKDIGVCKPDNLCQKIKNPVSYATRKAYFARVEAQKEKAKEEKKKQKEMQKEMKKKNVSKEAKSEKNIKS